MSWTSFAGGEAVLTGDWGVFGTAVPRLTDPFTGVHEVCVWPCDAPLFVGPRQRPFAASSTPDRQVAASSSLGSGPHGPEVRQNGLPDERKRARSW